MLIFLNTIQFSMLLYSVFHAVSGCGGLAVLNGTEGTVSSMGFPGGYSNKAECHWDINVAPGKLVHLHFHNFSLEESQLCISDKLKISDQTGSLGL